MHCSKIGSFPFFHWTIIQGKVLVPIPIHQGDKNHCLIVYHTVPRNSSFAYWFILLTIFCLVSHFAHVTTTVTIFALLKFIFKLNCFTQGKITKLNENYYILFQEHKNFRKLKKKNALIITGPTQELLIWILFVKNS